MKQWQSLEAALGWVGCACANALTSLQTVEHGFPNQPSALAFDPELRIMAIGTRSGAVKMYPLRAAAFGARQNVLVAGPRVLGPWGRAPAAPHCLSASQLPGGYHPGNCDPGGGLGLVAHGPQQEWWVGQGHGGPCAGARAHTRVPV